MGELVFALQGNLHRAPLKKSVTSIGRGAENDVVIDHPSIEARHAHVLRDRSGFRLFAVQGAQVEVDGRLQSEWRLTEGDTLRLGAVEVRYEARAEAERAADLPRGSPAPEAARVRLEAFRMLHDFSEKLATSPNLVALERNILDAVLELALADTGALFRLGDDGRPVFECARDRSGSDVAADRLEISTSILERAISTRRPVLTSDALEDTVFGEARSVINFGIRTMIAVPVVFGQEPLGALYLGAQRVTPGLLQPEFLEVLMVFAAEAGLLIANARLVETLRADNRALTEALSQQTFGEIVGACPSMQQVFRAVSRLAPADISVLVLGETGTGKELIARELHRRSGRKDGPFVAINVSAIPDSLLEAELFGHVKGAFTGAVAARRGKFAAAHGGTLFLDEIGDMPTTLQAKLLRVLQDRRVEPLGSNQPEAVDVRIVAATHRNLAELQESGRFRADLFYRISESQIVLPPLRDRGDDTALLATYFLGVHNEKLGRRIRGFTKRALAALQRYPWPGNVRELEAKIKNAVVMAEGAELDVGDLGIGDEALVPTLSLREAKERFAKRYVEEVLALNGGNRSKTARDLDVDPRTIFKYLEGK